jgi:O-antigen ligase
MPARTMAMGAGEVQVGARVFPGTAGFFFVFRAGLTFLFFQDDPVAGTAVSLGIGLALVYGAIVYSTEDVARPPVSLERARPLRWIFAMLALSLVSLAWTAAASRGVALAYWAGMAADMAIALLLLRRADPQSAAEAMMQGAIWGAAVLAVVAWCSPAAEDLRLGNDAFLHPNTLGLEIGLATLMAQYFAPRARMWKWVGIALAITLLRTLSKTAILAFAIAECWVLLQHKGMTRRTKMWIVALAAVVVASFWGVLTAYLDIYNGAGSGNQVETLTGRTVLWATSISMSLQTPWFGHGIDSFRALIPAFGSFEAVHAHNEWLQQFFEFGAAGVVLAGGVYGSFYRMARRARPGELRTLALGLLLFTLVRGLADTVSFGLSFPLWLIAALSICLVPREDEARA